MRDWDLWPLIVAAEAPEATALPVLVLSRRLDELRREIGLALYPVVRRLAESLREFGE